MNKDQAVNFTEEQRIRIVTVVARLFDCADAMDNAMLRDIDLTFQGDNAFFESPVSHINIKVTRTHQGSILRKRVRVRVAILEKWFEVLKWGGIHGNVIFDARVAVLEKLGLISDE